jgi:hypothetical protein
LPIFSGYIQNCLSYNKLQANEGTMMIDRPRLNFIYSGAPNRYNQGDGS